MKIYTAYDRCSVTNPSVTRTIKTYFYFTIMLLNNNNKNIIEIALFDVCKTNMFSLLDLTFIFISREGEHKKIIGRS